jgi:hypothetical protein
VGLPSLRRSAYFLLKVVALAFLIGLWRSTFLGGSANLLFFVLLLFAFNRALDLDITAGNITVFEQLVLWGGFAAYLRGRIGWFCSAVLLVAMFKVTPILFLVLLLLPRPGGEAPRRKNLAWLAGSAGVFAGINFASLLHDSNAWAGYAANARGMSTETGIIAPSTFALAHSLTEFAVSHGVPIAYTKLTPWVLYGVLAVGMAWVGWQSIGKLIRGGPVGGRPVPGLRCVRRRGTALQGLQLSHADRPRVRPDRSESLHEAQPPARPAAAPHVRRGQQRVLLRGGG